MQEESFRSAPPHSGAEKTQPLDSITHVRHLGTTTAYAIVDYCEFLCNIRTHLQLLVWEYRTVCAAPSVTPDKYTTCLSREKYFYTYLQYFVARKRRDIDFKAVQERKFCSIAMWSC